MKIGVAGVGGIGSNVARHLAQAGMMSLGIVDFDCVKTSNLNHQFHTTDQAGLKKTDCLKANLLAINPEMDIKTLDLKISPQDAALIQKDCHIVGDSTSDQADCELYPPKVALVAAHMASIVFTYVKKESHGNI